MNVPALRFKQDDGRDFPEWEEKRLADVGENIIGLTYSPSNVTDDKSFPIVLRSSNIKNDMLDLNDQVRVKEKVSGKLFTQENDILICTRNGSQRLIGKNVLISDVKIPMTFGAFMSVFRSPLNRFIVHLFKTESYNEQIQMNLGARINQITTKNLNAFIFNFPSEPEQSKIANFLTAVDEKIQLLTQKHDLLTQYKKGVMQQIFRQELRFKDDDGGDFPEWEEKQLGQLCSITTGKLDANAMVEDGQYRFYTCAREYYQIDKYTFDTEALLISGNGANVGYIHYYKGKFNAYQRTYVLDGFKQNIIFIKYFLDEFLHVRIFKEAKEGNTPYIVMGTLTDMEIKIPSLPEQTKIANFLTAIDDKITSTKAQLDAVKQYKQGLLQQMFV